MFCHPDDVCLCLVCNAMHTSVNLPPHQVIGCSLQKVI